MLPVRTAASNFVYRGPSPDIGDAWCERVPAEQGVYLEWQPSEEERAAVADGALIRLGIFGREPISPVSLNVSEHEVLSDAGAALRDQARDVLKRDHGVLGPAGIPAGHWLVSSDVWTALQAEHALDPLGQAALEGPDDAVTATHVEVPTWVTDLVPEREWVTLTEASRALKTIKPQGLRTAAQQRRDGTASALAARLGMRRLGRDWLIPRDRLEAEVARRAESCG